MESTSIRRERARSPLPSIVFVSALPATEVLARTDHVELGVSRCGATGRNAGDEEMEPEFAVVFPIEGVFVRHTEGKRVVATSAVALFFEKGQVHRVSHPTGGHDVCLNVVLGPDLVEPFLDRHDRFGRLSVPTSPATFISILRSARRVHDPLEAEELAVTTVSDALMAPGVPASAGRRDLVTDTEEYLAANFKGHMGLVAIAKAVGASPHHLSRTFRSVNGLTLSERRTQLRLRSALHRLLEGADDIATVAVESGFYDHSHLTNTMRRRLGLTPSQVRSA